jgi:Fe-S-cluster containining protein
MTDIIRDTLKGNGLLQRYFKLNPDEINDPGKQKEFLTEINKFKRFYEERRRFNGMAVLAEFFMLADNLIERFFMDVKQKSSCKKGCSFCCHVSTDISEDEAFLIADYCKTNGIGIPAAYLHSQLLYEADKIYMSSCSACVFLKDNKCSIYPVRPIACRKYFVFTPASLCEQASKNKSPIDVEVIEVFNYALEKLLCGIQNTEIKWGRMPLMLLPYAK